MTISERRSVVAIDVTTRGLAYVFFENGRLIEWENLRRSEEDGDIATLDRIMDGCAADIVVLEDPDDNECRLGDRARRVLRTLARHARCRGIRVRLIARAEVRKAWRTRGASNRHQVAAAIAEQFPELLPFLPPPRKNYEPEDERMSFFDAIALALHAYGRPAVAP